MLEAFVISSSIYLPAHVSLISLPTKLDALTERQKLDYSTSQYSQACVPFYIAPNYSID